MELSTELNLILFIMRLVIGLTICAHGWNKFFGGGRIPGTGRWFESIGVRKGKLNAYLAASTELCVGLMLAAGLLTSFASAGLIGLMVVAGWTVHRNNGFFITKEGWEYILVLTVVAMAIATIGPGEWSLDNVLNLGSKLDGWAGFLLSLLLGVGAGLSQLFIFYRPKEVA
jgi:putative oxidoreductase